MKSRDSRGSAMILPAYLFGLMVLFGTLACSGPSSSPSSSGQSQEPHSGGTLTIGNGFEPFSLDMHMFGSGVGTTMPLSPTQAQLIQYDPQDETKLIGDAAERWDVSPDGKVFTFYLHKNIKFHDGTPLTAADVKANFERWKKPPAGVSITIQNRNIVRPVSTIETPDDYTVRITLGQPQPSFLSLLAWGGSSLYPKRLIDNNTDFANTIVGAGPFKFVDYTRGTSVTLEKNPDYFVQGRPYLDKIVNFIMNDENTRLSALRTGQVLFVLTLPGLLPSQVEVVRRAIPDFVVLNPASIHVDALSMNAKNSPLNDARVRRAINLAIDRNAVNEVARQGIDVLGGSMIPTGKWGFSSDEVAKLPGFRQPKDADLAEAKRLMAEAGYANGFKAVDLVRQGRVDEDMAQVLRAEFAKINIDFQLRIVEQSARTVLINEGKFDFVNTTSSGHADDPDYFLSGFYSKLASQWVATNPEMDRLYEEQTQTLDPNKRKELARQADRLLLEYVPNVILGWARWNWGHWAKVKNYKAAGIIYNNLKMQDVWLAD